MPFAKTSPARDASKSPLGPTCLGNALTACRFLSSWIASLHSLSVYAGHSRVSRCLSNCPDGLYRTLRDIWFTRLVRELLTPVLKTPLRGAALALVDCAPPANFANGCVIAICHTPWARLLAEWCREREFALVLAGGVWVYRSGHLHVPGGVAGLRRLVRHLRDGGRAVVIADVFGRSRRCPVRFLGEDRLASLLPARLATLARVPLQAAVPSLQANRIHIRFGPRFTAGTSAVEQQTITQSLLSFFEREIRRRPALCNYILKAPRAV